jgi:2Fe-2S ferredoxin
MPKIHYVAYDGRRTAVEGEVGHNLMETAVKNRVAGIVGECGGSAACSTCHVFVDAPWLAKLNPRNTSEEALLEWVDGANASSRLGCQIEITPELDGLVVRMPEKQVSQQ